VSTWFGSVFRELESLHDFRAALKQIALTWRVVIVVALGQAAGGLAGLWAHPLEDSFKDFAAGAILTTVPALGIGLAWELADPVRRQRSPRAIRLLYILSAFGLLLIGLGNFVLWHLASNNRWRGR
jgi:hypothetical protein